MDRKLAILVVDGHPIVRWALREFLVGRPDVRAVMEADSLREALNLIDTQCPDIVITDLALPDLDSQDGIRELVRRAPGGVIAFTDNDTWDCVEEFLSEGGMGFVSKRSAMPELTAAVKAVAAKQKWIAPSVRSVPARAGLDTNSAPGLTAREREIVALITKGFTSKQIAGQLCVSLKTIETHRYRIFRKLKIKHCAQLADYAIRHGISRAVLQPSSDKLS